ncbi:hypothetical protein L596_004743 [Steinernema carpocapsae]|uniref:Uncharacterized protein n=1 Tax=Steinernema carpocapsae TaxID=34508 RepID=A0A4U8UWU9_STECR|nr:hypothetical protein L596_004743 [Steinernema carpocapsae]
MFSSKNFTSQSQKRFLSILYILFDRDGLGQVAGTIDVLSVQFGDVVAEKLERDDGENVLNAIHGLGHAENVLQTGQVSLGHVVIRDDDGAPSSRKHLLQGIERLLVDVVLADDHHNAQLIVHHPSPGVRA